jgi:hypothetical protein
MWWLSLILLLFAGIMNSVMDVLKTRYQKSIFRECKNQLWIDPAMSWPNKWKNGDKNKGERFPGSSTVFVWLTDFWHLTKFLMLLFISFAIVFYHPIIIWWVDWFILYCSFTIPFEIFYSKILIKS